MRNCRKPTDGHTQLGLQSLRGKHENNSTQIPPTLKQHAASVARALETELIGKMEREHADTVLKSPSHGRDKAPTIKRTRVARSGKIRSPATDPFHESHADVAHLTAQLANLIAKQISQQPERTLNQRDTNVRCHTAELLLAALDEHLANYDVEKGNTIHRIYHTAHQSTVDATGEPNPYHVS